GSAAEAAGARCAQRVGAWQRTVRWRHCPSRFRRLPTISHGGANRRSRTYSGMARARCGCHFGVVGQLAAARFVEGRNVRIVDPIVKYIYSPDPPKRKPWPQIEKPLPKSPDAITLTPGLPNFTVSLQLSASVFPHCCRIAITRYSLLDPLILRA